MFPESLHLGLDVLFTPGFRSHYLLEINAFGDLLPNVVHRGVNAYEAEVEAMALNFDDFDLSGDHYI